MEDKIKTNKKYSREEIEDVANNLLDKVYADKEFQELDKKSRRDFILSGTCDISLTELENIAKKVLKDE